MVKGINEGYRFVGAPEVVRHIHHTIHYLLEVVMSRFS